MRNIRKIKRIVQEYETFCCFISVSSTLAIQFDAKWFSGIFCNLIQEDYKNIDRSTTDPGVEFLCLLESFDSIKNFLQCTKSFMRAMSKFKMHVRGCRRPQVAGWSQILSWPELMFSKRVCYDFLNRRSKCRKLECFESSAWQIERLESWIVKCFKSSEWCFLSFPCSRCSPIWY